MHTTETISAVTGKTKNTPLAKFKRGMEAALVNAGQSIESKFAEAYDDVELALVNEIPQKTIIENLNNAYDLRLHPKRFRELLHTERNRRHETGDAATCKTCGQPLHMKAPRIPIESSRATHAADSAAKEGLA